MKSLRIAALALLISPAFLHAQEVTVRGNSKLNTDFSKYKTYSWAQMDITPSEGDYQIYSYREEVVAPVTTQTTKSNTSKNSTKAKSKDVSKSKKPLREPYIYSYSVIIPSPNATVNSSIQASIAEELEGRGYRMNESSPDLIVAYKVLDRPAKVKGYVNDDPTVINGNTEVREPKDTTTYAVEAGTLMINLIDAKNSQVVWDGFASGLAQGNIFTVDPIKLKEAIHLIFEEFKYSADDLSTKAKK